MRTTWCNLHHRATLHLLWLCVIRDRYDDAAPLRNVVRLKPAPRLPERPFCTRFGTCVMSVPFQGEISMTIRDQQMRNSTAAPADRPYDEHRVIADTWLRHTIDGIRQMHVDDDVRREVAGRIF
ncbi:hypothetical protein KDW55_17975 [Burkholderia sp. AU19243]|uniref:hypothetical protein n=1 Tax=Burkholderia sp. AU19243 TaxID=2824810 RepID=UPI001B980E25|nr:hypothetical protein [Burkholderia sp. AU19243]MBR8142588.1 hypothetical protein [Burkholderia vietnamiensis]MBR8365206.1 hypothetical protein [Burkholderia sp. AU19243]